MKEKINNIITILQKEIITSTAELQNFKSKYTCILSNIISDFKMLPLKKKKEYGQYINKLKTLIDNTYKNAYKALKKHPDNEKYIDYSLPIYSHIGNRHPIATLKQKIVDIFCFLGFTMLEGQEIEDDWHNFTALNIPYDHPARDMQDTFFFTQNKQYLLRTHTSSVQIRTLETNKIPLRCFSIGKVYRNETISSRSNCFFHQVECFCVDENVSFQDFKFVLFTFLRKLFGQKTKINIRSSFFPFTSPSIEVDIECLICKGKGCSICKRSGWLEVLGGGLIHEQVLKNCGINTIKYSGYAMGGGLERIALLTHHIDDLRLFAENNIRFLKQFS